MMQSAVISRDLRAFMYDQFLKLIVVFHLTATQNIRLQCGVSVYSLNLPTEVWPVWLTCVTGYSYIPGRQSNYADQDQHHLQLCHAATYRVTRIIVDDFECKNKCLPFVTKLFAITGLPISVN